ncbi:hypothetical protein VARV_IND64_vel4_185 [Variola virus]|uniref:B11R protein n=3 Tax=Variola virus TaxID=10255 RepID=Q76QZ1_VAR67|nr:hypothetical protein VARVgp179 [Variola virus]AAA60919.1 putative [Variola major virus]AAA69451.1 B10R [Variola virus]AAS58491.1 B10R [Variola major virus]AAS58493.1 B10R [Variola major virus]AAS58495.1 B10R [Variola major virus]
MTGNHFCLHKNQARLETIYETIKMQGTTNNNDGSKRTSPIYDNVGNTKDSLTYVNINKVYMRYTF